MPNANNTKDDKRSSNSIRKRQSASGLQNNAYAKTTGDDSKFHDSTASNIADMPDKAEAATNGGDNNDNFTRRLLKRKANRSNGESDVEWEKARASVAFEFLLQTPSFADSSYEPEDSRQVILIMYWITFGSPLARRSTSER